MPRSIGRIAIAVALVWAALASPALASVADQGTGSRERGQIGCRRPR